jgi:type III pantothenate kinase
LITVKMGVSRITLAVHDRKGRILSILVRKTPHEELSPEGWESHLSLPEWFGGLKSPVAIASVVPQYDTALQKALVAGGKKWMIPLTIPDWGLAVRYSPQGALGVDRLAVCRGSLERFPELKRQGWVVADFGTHTVLTVVINHTIFGGSISPGIMTQLQSIGRGLVLGRYPLQYPERPVGENTAECVSSGVVLGAVRGVEGLFREMEAAMGQQLTLVLTGGLSRYLRPLFRLPNRCDRHLVHAGIWEAAHSSRKKRSVGR